MPMQTAPGLVTPCVLVVQQLLYGFRSSLRRPRAQPIIDSSREFLILSEDSMLGRFGPTPVTDFGSSSGCTGNVLRGSNFEIWRVGIEGVTVALCD